MLLTFFCFLTLAISGLGLCRASTHRLGLKSNLWIELGLGFFISAAVVAIILDVARLSLSQTSHTILLLSGVVALSTAIRLRSDSTEFRLLDWVGSFNSSWLTRICVCLIALYLGLILLNNMNREIFPWDAFTTWMFRAKAWVASDTAVTFITLKEWLAASTGFTLPAAHYPIAVSAIAAFASALSGEWSSQAASIPWFFAMTASTALMGGLCLLQTPDYPKGALLGAALLSTLPLVHWHGVLAGYADLWVMGTSGMGLAGICLWSQGNGRGALTLSLLLLVLGCLWKAEGWLWLILGCAIVTLLTLWQRFSIKGLIALVTAVAAVWLFQPLDLGPVGIWGGNADRISAGVLGSFATRPYNAAPDYFDMTVSQGNFLLIVPLYTLSLLILTIKHRRASAGYLVMAAGLVVLHAVIFGFSEYSRYAEIGTAVNRLLLQNLPVLIFTITAAWSLERRHTTNSEKGNDAQREPASKLTCALLGASAALAFPITLGIYSLGTNSSNKITASQYDPSELVEIVGEIKQTDLGYQFSGTDLPIGVAAIPLTKQDAKQPRYIAVQTWMTEPETLSIYWINSTAPDVHSVPLSLSGHSLLDMADYPDFWQQPIQEMGFLAEPEYFASTAIGPVTLTDSLFDAIPALLHHWASPEPISQRLINTTTGHAQAPATLHSALTVALMLLCLVGFAWQIKTPAQAVAARYAVFNGACILWLVGSLAHLNHVTALTQPTMRQIAAASNTRQLEGSHLTSLADSIREDPTLSAVQILTLGLDQASQFEAQRLPFMLLPASATPVDGRLLAEIKSGFSGALVLFGKDPALIQSAAMELVATSSLQPVRAGAGYLVLTATFK